MMLMPRKIERCKLRSSSNVAEQHREREHEAEKTQLQGHEYALADARLEQIIQPAGKAEVIGLLRCGLSHDVIHVARHVSCNRRIVPDLATGE